MAALRDALAQAERIEHHAAGVALHLVAVVLAKAVADASAKRGGVVGAHAIVQRVAEHVGEADVDDVLVVEQAARQLVERVPVVGLDGRLRRRGAGCRRSPRPSA